MTSSDARSHIQNIAFCPDCLRTLSFDENSLVCGVCGHQVIEDDGVFDLLPQNPLAGDPGLTSEINDFYLSWFRDRTRHRIQEQSSETFRWGNYEGFPRGYRVFISEELSLIRKHLSKVRTSFCDLSGGAGDLSFVLAREFDLVVICDINRSSLVQAKRRAEKQGLSNIIFARIDYLQLPFRTKRFDSIICTDSFNYYGPEVDVKVIERIQETLNSGGVFLFDLHHRKFYSRNDKIFEYSRNDIWNLKKAFPNLKVFGFGRLPTRVTVTPWIHRLGGLLLALPPVRHFCILERT